MALGEGLQQSGEETALQSGVRRSAAHSEEPGAH